jgi:hypothetical protein
MAEVNKEFQKELAEVAPAPLIPGPVEDLTGFNVEYGFLEGFLRGTSLNTTAEHCENASRESNVAAGDWDDVDPSALPDAALTHRSAVLTRPPDMPSTCSLFYSCRTLTLPCLPLLPRAFCSSL